MLHLRRSRAATASLLLLVFGGGFQGMAQEAAVPVTADWKAERKTIEDRILTKLDMEAKRKIIPRKVAEDLKLQWPVRDTAKSTDEIKAAVDAEVAAEMDKQYPRAAMEQFRKKGTEVYRLYQQGEDIHVVLRGGLGTSTKVSGRLSGIGATQVKIGARRVNLNDLEEADRAHLDAETHAHMVDAYVKKEMAKFLLRRETVAEDMRARLLPQRFSDNGYRKERQGKKEVWISEKTILDRELERRRKDLEATERKKLETELYAAAGFVLNGKEWMPKAVAEAMKKTGTPGEGAGGLFGDAGTPVAGVPPVAAAAPAVAPAPGMPPGPMPPPGGPPMAMPPGMPTAPGAPLPPGAPAGPGPVAATPAPPAAPPAFDPTAPPGAPPAPVAPPAPPPAFDPTAPPGAPPAPPAPPAAPAAPLPVAPPAPAPAAVPPAAPVVTPPPAAPAAPNAEAKPAQKPADGPVPEFFR